jgi:SAM-dependent methyltransferase
MGHHRLVPLSRTLERIRRRFDPKGAAELEFWRERHAAEGRFANRQFERFFTEQWGIGREFYAGKRMLDLGCGPRGSLEWADMAAERVGADPLVHRYRELGIEAHAMTYVKAGAERLPFDTGHFDVVSCFNALDHVDDVDAAIAEMTRVAAPGALGLLLVEIGHAPTVHEPHTLSWDLLDEFEGWEALDSWRTGIDAEHDVYGSWLRREPWDGGPGLLAAKLRRQG